MNPYNASPTLVFWKPLPSLKEGDRDLASPALAYFSLWGLIPCAHPMYAEVGYEVKGTKVKNDSEKDGLFVVPVYLSSVTETYMKSYKNSHRAF